MPTLDSLVSVQVDLATQAFSSASFSRMVVLYATTDATETTPQLVESLPDALAVTTITAGSYAYNDLAAVFAQSPGASSVLVLPFQSPTTAASPVTALNGQEASLNALGGFYGVIFTEAATYQQAVADWCNANKKLYVTLDSSGTGGDTTTSDLASYFKTENYDYCAALCSAAAESPGASSTAAAWMSKAFGYQAGSENWSNMTLSGVLTDTLTATQRANILGKYGNTFEPYGNPGGNSIALTFKGTTGSGRYIDEIRGRDALCNDIKTAVANVLMLRPKLPYTDAGISAVKGAILAVLEKYMRIGFLDSPTTNSDGSVSASYSVVIPTRAQASTQAIQARDLEGITFQARLAGAIDTVTDAGGSSSGIIGTLVYSLS